MKSRYIEKIVPLFGIGLLLSALPLFSHAARAETLTLKQCLEQADRANPGLRTAAWDTAIARQNTRQAASALYPRLDIQGGYTLQHAPQAVKINGFTAETQEPDFAFGNLAATYTIYDFGRSNARVQQARSQSEAIASQFEARRKDLSLQVIAAYFGILEAGRLAATAREEVVQVEQHRRVAQALFDEGAVTRNDVLQAEVRLAAARQRSLEADNRVENSWLRLNYLTASPPTFRADLEPEAAIAADALPPVDQRQVFDQRHEIQALRHRLSSSEAEVREAGASFFPELYTRLMLDYVQNDKVREQAIMSATVGLRFNLFDGFASSAARERAVSQRSKNRDALRQAEEEVQLDIATAGNDVRVARERIAVAETALRQSEENLRINRERYRERVGTATEVLDAQTLLTQTRSDHDRALFDYQVASARLKHARGEL
jgi:outer membrane protein